MLIKNKQFMNERIIFYKYIKMGMKKERGERSSMGNLNYVKTMNFPIN